ncbi:uncharacterized protein PFL1_01990 [Pseudozyma flocculosa PF-1]|uniref:DUF6924 domain-containing protein n=1 Tax=Pseudozyma flocculosa TaxID=84751 RepID=A0A5C3F0U5_9BASI|nr:uncharacterized protein PFL1_01990 [Pseudozyma flocculosa PF-1]EPQ30464.1 hypothetical protein PFL1_01990 [Pseudozyma flocculosa PF-1]SPO37546.1 uncharacterized protein PSFLO_03021 [Pseudozyma flocculosa]
MKEQIAFYVLAACQKAPQAVLDEIRTSDTIDETNSGEGPREQCPLYDFIELASHDKLSSLDDVLADLRQRSADTSRGTQWDASHFVVAGHEANANPSVVVFYELSEKGDVQGQLKCTAPMVLDPACNIPIANMDLEEFQDACGQDGIFRGFQ